MYIMESYMYIIAYSELIQYDYLRVLHNYIYPNNK